MNSKANIASYTMLGWPDICCHTTVLDRWQHILSFHSLVSVHYWFTTFAMYMYDWDKTLKYGLAMCINCLSPMFSTTDNGCISHVMKLPMASTKVCHHSLSFGSGLLHFKTFCGNSCDCSERLSLSHFVLAITYYYLLQWCHSKCTLGFVLFLL